MGPQLSKTEVAVCRTILFAVAIKLRNFGSNVNIQQPIITHNQVIR